MPYDENGEWVDNEQVRAEGGYTMLTNRPQYKDTPNTLYMDEPTGEMTRYGEEGEEVSTERVMAPKYPSKPSDQELDFFNKWLKFKEELVKHIKVDPESEYIGALSRKMDELAPPSAVDRALENPRDYAVRKRIAEEYAHKYRKDAETQYNHEIEQGRTLFMAEMKKLEESQKNEREKKEEQERYNRAVADKKEAAEKKARLEKTPWKLSDGPDGYKIYARVSPDGETEIKPTQIPNKTEKGPTIDNYNKVADMVTKAKDTGLQSDIEMAKEAANAAGYDLVQSKKPVKTTFGKDKEVIDFTLVKKGEGTPKNTGAKKQIGTKNGKPVYDLGNGKWQIGD